MADVESGDILGGGVAYWPALAPLLFDGVLLMREWLTLIDYISAVNENSSDSGLTNDKTSIGTLQESTQPLVTTTILS